MTGSPEVIGPSDVVAALLNDAPSLLARSREMIEPVQRERAAIRELFASTRRLVPLGDEPGGFQVGCTDGGYTSSPLVIGDHVATMSVAVAQRDREQSVGVVAHRQWSDFRGHSPDTELLAQAMMMIHEIELVSALPSDGVKMLDGSFLTHLVTIHAGLASSDAAVREVVSDAVAARAFRDGLREVVTNPLVVACPKSDSSLALWAEITAALPLGRNVSLPDKALATLLLHPGEVLHPGPSGFDWSRVHIARARVVDEGAAAAARDLEVIAAPLLQEGTVNPIFVKPHTSNLCLRIEARSELASFDRDDVISSISETVVSPFLQEPLAQYVADLFAKQVAIGTSVQAENLRLDLASLDGSREFIDYFARYYRTNRSAT